MGGRLTGAGLALAMLLATPACAADFLTPAPADHTLPTQGPTRSIGSAANGCLAGAVAMPWSGPGWQVTRPAANRYWGTPEMIAFLEDMAARNRARGTILIGDIGLPRGGRMPTGHASHQIGVDVDILFRLARGPVSTAERDDPEYDQVDKPDGSLDPIYWGADQVALLKSAVADPRVERIFVNPNIKRALCESEPDRAWLHKLRPWWGHEAHFHVRLNCPPGDQECRTSAPVPPGDGCGPDLAWWFTQEARSPAPPAPGARKPQPPAACAGILATTAG